MEDQNKLVSSRVSLGGVSLLSWNENHVEKLILQKIKIKINVNV